MDPVANNILATNLNNSYPRLYSYWRLLVIKLVLGVVAAIAVLTACQSTETQPHTSHSTPKIIPHEQADLNLPLFLKVGNLAIERTIRDNGTSVIDRYKVDGNVFTFSERLVEDTWFDQSIQDKVGDPRYLQSLLKSSRQKFEAGNPQPARQNNSGRAVGSYSINGNCQAFVVGLKLRVGSLYDNDPGNIDTIAFFSGCDMLTQDLNSVIRELGRPSAADRASIAMQRE